MLKKTFATKASSKRLKQRKARKRAPKRHCRALRSIRGGLIAASHDVSQDLDRYVVLRAPALGDAPVNGRGRLNLEHRSRGSFVFSKTLAQALLLWGCRECGCRVLRSLGLSASNPQLGPAHRHRPAFRTCQPRKSQSPKLDPHGMYTFESCRVSHDNSHLKNSCGSAEGGL